MIADGLRRKARALQDDFPYYSEHCLKVRDKSGATIPFKLNTAQRYLHKQLEAQRARTGRVRAIVVKGRQQGVSTYVQGRYIHHTTLTSGRNAFILTHEADATGRIFAIAQRFYENLPGPLKPKRTKDSATQLVFGELDSGYEVGTAGNKAVGRSATIQLFHGSESSYWPNAHEHAAGILRTIPDEPGTEIILESTANGIGNYFHEQAQLAMRGESRFALVFIPWFWQQEYRADPDPDFQLTDDEAALVEAFGLRPDQLQWRRHVIAELSSGGVDGAHKFRVEYPCTVQEAFEVSGELSLIDAKVVLRARKGAAQAVGPLVVGVDPARFGKDRTAIIRRRGRVAYRLQTYRQKDTMEVAGLVHKILVEEKPEKVFIDVGGLGAGVVDRLREMGYGDKIVAVNSGEKPLDPDRYVNRRAEMWGLLNEWLHEAPVQIPDLDELHADLCGPRYSWDSLNRLKLERKEDMMKRGLASPDCAEALALTLAQPVVSIEVQKAMPRLLPSFIGDKGAGY